MARRLSAFGALRLVFNFTFFILPTAALRITRAFIRAWMKKLPLGPSMWNGFAGTLMHGVPPDQLQAILPSTVDTYTSWMKSNGKTPDVQLLPTDSSTRLLWIGPRNSKKLLLFFHGGGYVMPMNPGHLGWMNYIRNEAIAAGVDLSVCLLQYDLIPTNPYPRQMLQATLAFEHLLASGYKPSDIVFGGDSAGAHLSLSLMAHLHHNRHFDGTAGTLAALPERVRGCVLLSPLASLDLNTPSYNKWFSADVLGKKVVRDYGDYLINGTPWHGEIAAGNAWGMALDVPEKWWANLDIVDRILVTGGYEEVFSDHVQQLGRMLRRNSKGEVIVYMAHETHDDPLMDFAAGRPARESTKVITDFVISSLKE